MINFLNQTDIEKDLDTDYKTLRFLRCAAIFDHFARSCKIIENRNDSEFIDWDEILSSNYLCNFFNVPDAFKKFVNPGENIDHASDDEMVLPMFKLIDVPKNFLDFIHQPFNAPVLDFGEEESVICLLTGKIIKIPIDEFNNFDLRELIEEKFGNSFSIFLRLNAKYASQVFVLNYEFDYYLKLSSFYRDQFGDTDIGMERGSLLYLNEVSQEDIIDNFLSGLWTNTISI